ncbi:MAG: OmpA family protein [Chloroflexota bacterium]
MAVRAASSTASPGIRRRAATAVLSATVLAASLGTLVAPAVHATEPALAESFMGATIGDPGSWVTSYGGTEAACLTAASGTQSLGSGDLGPCGSADAAGEGALRLTSASGSQSAMMLYNVPMSTASGLDITFSIAQYGGSGADGISFFLQDGANSSTTPDAFGGALGYANLAGSGDPQTPGIPGGLVGIGFDVYGNYSSEFAWPDDTGAPGARASSVAVRGADTGAGKNGSDGYTWLGGTGTDTIDYSGGDRSAAARKIRVVIDPSTDASPMVSVYVGDAATLPDAATVTVAQPAELKAAGTFKFGFAASTGGSTDIHEVWGLSIGAKTPPVPPVPGLPGLRTVHFGPNSAVLSLAEKRALRVWAAKLPKSDFIRIAIDGYAFRTGHPAAELAVAKARAVAVSAYLHRLGIKATYTVRWHRTSHGTPASRRIVTVRAAVPLT